MPRTTLESRTIPGGINTIQDNRLTTGSVFYVHAGTGSSSNSGKSPSKPKATIDQAINLCTASKGDIIFVMPGHAESITGAAGIALDVIGVSVIGLGTGRNRPVITFTTAAGASCDVSAASCRLENLVFVCAIDDQTAMVNVTAADVTIRGCEFSMGDATYDAECGVLASAAADRLLIEGCHLFSTSTTAITSGAISCGATDNTIIRDTVIFGYFATAGNIVNTAAAANFNVIGCTLTNLTADGNNKNIVLHSSTTGLIARNNLAVIDSMSPAPLTAAAGYVAGNYSAAAAGVSASTLI